MKHNPTAEQEAIVSAVRQGGTTLIEAYAGTGKTTTMEMVAECAPKVLFVVFNTRNKDEAIARMPKNVVCKTTHGLAFPKYGSRMIDRINGMPRNNSRTIAIKFGLKGTLVCRTPGAPELRIKPPNLVQIALSTVTRFQNSSARIISEDHVAVPEGAEAHEALIRREIVELAQRIWAEMISPRGCVKPSHDTYLKEWTLSNPILRFPLICVDEAQDMNECMAGVLDNQPGQLVVIGDSYQSLYSWRGAVDYLSRVNAKHRLTLSQSWRFGQVIADEGNIWLKVVDPQSNAAVKGNPALTSEIRPLELSEVNAILCRSNAGTIEQLIMAQGAGVKVHLVGDGIEMKLLAEAAQRMQAGDYPNHPELSAFKTWEEVVRYAEEDPAGSDLALSVRMIEKYGAGTIVQVISACCKADENPELEVSTAHKAKGREWDNVQIASDFKEPLDKETGDPLPIPKEEAMLAYVAVTRAKKVLDNAGLAWVHEHFAEI